MNFLKKIVLVAFIGSAFVTCKKEELPQNSTAGQPVFSFSGIINNNNISLQAGINNYYMYSSYTQDSLGVYNFIGTLQSTTTKNSSIQIIINDDTLLPRNAPSNISKSVSPSVYYAYNVPGGGAIRDSVSFKPRIYAGIPLSYSYQFGDGSSSNAEYPVHYYKIQSINHAFLSSLSVGFSCGIKTMSNPVIITKQATSQLTIDSISSILTADSANSHTVSLTAYIKNGTPPYTYVWDFGNGSTSSSMSTNTSVTVSHIYDSSATAYTVALGVADVLSDNAIYTYSLIDTTNTTCRMDYFVSTPAPVPNPNAFSNVTVVYTDGKGNQYSSYNAAQPDNYSFQITSVSNYQNNLNNNPTEMLNITFNCVLYPVLGGSPISATNCTAVIAVAY